MYVACQADCTEAQVDLFGRDPPLIALCEEPEQTPKSELIRGGGVRPLEGADTKTSAALEESGQDPPGPFLDTLWEGSWRTDEG